MWGSGQARVDGLTMAHRQAVGKTVATRCRRADAPATKLILDELCGRRGGTGIAHIRRCGLR